ncbi:hypothetical protein LJR290_006478 [Variovorax sp. LjRoot290]|uniref:hypothetical protein n=1 Tax=unclassified Variovorax TaxID=663243 RepID=UPI003ECD4DF0
MRANRRDWLQTVVAIATALPIAQAIGAHRASQSGPSVPTELLLNEQALVESRLFAAAWRGGIQQINLGPSVDEALFGPHAVNWRRLRGPVIGLTTPATLFCLEQVAAADGVRTVARVAAPEAGAVAIAVERLRARLGAPSSWRPLEPTFDAAPYRWVAWLMAPRLALNLDS